MNFDPSQLKKYINIAFISILVLISFMLLLSILSTAGLMASGIISIIINAVILGVGIFSYIKLKNIAKNIEIEDFVKSKIENLIISNQEQLEREMENLIRDSISELIKDKPEIEAQLKDEIENVIKLNKEKIANILKNITELKQ